MTADDASWYDRVYAAADAEEATAAYDGWADSYDTDLYRAGYRLPPIVTGLVCRHVPPAAGPLLEGAVGTGLIGALLEPLGYRDITGFDPSTEMLRVAEAKRCYRRLRCARFGERLDFDDDAFAASLVVGAFTPGHAGPDALPELVRLTRPGGHVVFSLRVDGDAGVDFLAEQQRLEDEGAWTRVERTPPVASLPLAEPDVRHRVFVYRVA